MKYAYISDIHGNAVALEAVLDDIAVKKVDKVFVLGDICFRGPEPKRALELVRSLKTEVIKGNADEWVVRGINDGEVPEAAIDVMREERKWTVNQLTNEEITYLRDLPMELTAELPNGIQIHSFHATPHSLFEIVPPRETDEIIEEKLMGKAEASIFLYGHIHFPYVRFFNGKCVANLGSVGLPFDGDNRASYLIVEENKDHFNIGIQRVKYNVERVLQQFKENDYPNKSFMTALVQTGKIR